MAINYAERFERRIEQQYAIQAKSADLATNRKYNFIDAQTIKISTIQLSGYKDHSRDGTVNRGTVGNTWEAYTLGHDRDISFYVDDMDVDETNRVLSAANVTAAFNEEQAIPELDAYRFSKLYSELVRQGGTPINTVLSSDNILEEFDKIMEAMDEAGVPTSGRIMKVTPTVARFLKSAAGIERSIDVSGGATGLNRIINRLDEVVVDVVPSDRLKTTYDFTDGFTPGVDAKQIHMIVAHPSAILAPVKVADVYLWGKGETPDSAFGWLYQNRSYQDLFIVKQKVAGVQIIADATGD